MASKEIINVDDTSLDHYQSLGKVCRRCCTKCSTADSRTIDHGRNITEDRENLMRGGGLK